MPLLKDFKVDHEKYEKQSRTTETGMFESVNAMEKGLLSFDREKMFEEAANKMKEEAINQRLND